jgi:hypothetical protein
VFGTVMEILPSRFGVFVEIGVHWFSDSATFVLIRVR